MENELIEIGLRLKGLRDALDIPLEDFAQTCGLPVDEYLEYEKGQKDFSISMLKKIAANYNVDIATLMFADEPRMSSYYITRKGTGTAINRRKEYAYEALASGFQDRQADFFIVTVEPNSSTNPVAQNSHSGYEFNFVLEGQMQLQISGKELILDEGDSIYFNAHLRHGMKALGTKTLRFLAVVI